MDYKRQIVGLSVMFVLVGMIFLVPAITEKAQATIDARAELKGHIGTSFFTKVARTHLDSGRFVPGFFPGQRDIFPGGFLTWKTMGASPFGGSERGYVVADVRTSLGLYPVTFHFNNPASGHNTCAVTTESPLSGFCARITQGNHADALYSAACNLFSCKVLPRK